jgi:SAM-dependent methyltransferase
MVEPIQCEPYKISGNIHDIFSAGVINMSQVVPEEPALDVNELREAIRKEYEAVATSPEQGFHFHTGRPLARLLDYDETWLEGIPEASIESFAGTGNPFSLGQIKAGERVVDVGSGAGIDSLIASKMVGPAGYVVGVDMTPAMLKKAQQAAAVAGQENVAFRDGFGEALPVSDGWADVVISNGVLNLMPDKLAGLQEMARVLKPTGRLQIGDILVQKAVPESGKRQIDLWTG